MIEELQVLSPLVPTREFSVLRYCHQIKYGTWAIVKISYEFPPFISQSLSYRFPFGCLIQDISNYYSKVCVVCNYSLCFILSASRIISLYHRIQNNKLHGLNMLKWRTKNRFMRCLKIASMKD